MEVKALVITGDGLNCERETARAFKLAGASATIMHINDLLKKPSLLQQYTIFAIPGGFSFGDEINSGKILALKIQYGLGSEFKTFVESGKLVLGVCNGFQSLVKLGLLPNPFSERQLTLSHNHSKKFINRWVELESEQNSVCVWTKGVEAKFFLPIRHGEGRVILKGDAELFYNELKERGQIPLRYREDINGSHERIAGLCDPSGRIFGLMPHPEAAISQLLNPYKARQSRDDIGLTLFKNAVQFCQQESLL